jgi:hypothetical protein
MSGRLGSIRLVFALLMVILGAAITIRGVAESAPFSFVAMGALLAILGVIRLGIVRAPAWERGKPRGGSARGRRAGR